MNPSDEARNKITAAGTESTVARFTHRYMINAEPPPRRAPASWLVKPLRWLFIALGFLCRVALVGWGTLAIYYSNLPWPWLRLVLALAFMAFGIWALWRSRRPLMFLAFTGLFLGVLVWWISIRPSHHRPWRPEVAVMPRAIIDGNRVHFTGVRNFEYRTKNEFTARYEERDVSLSSLTSIDFFVSYWMPGPVGHTL